MKHSKALIIIAKFPDADRVKTRLRGSLPDEQRLELYVALLEHSVNKLKAIPGIDTFIAYAPEQAGTYFSQFRLPLIALRQCGLGENMCEAFEDVFHRGYRKAALVGTDIPGLSPAIIRKAFAILSHKDLVYGPARDGGYYLVGMRRLIKDVFEDVPWSSNQTLEKSIAQAARAGATVGFTETLSDLDTIEDFKVLGFPAGINSRFRISS